MSIIILFSVLVISRTIMVVLFIDKICDYFFVFYGKTQLQEELNMAKGFNKNKERLDKLNSFGRYLAKRAGSKCELCEDKGVKLSIFELPPISDEPDIDSCIFICDKCLDSVGRYRKVSQNSLNFLNGSIWSEVPAVQSLSLFLLRELQDEMWARDILDNAYLSEDVEKRAGEIKF